MAKEVRDIRVHLTKNKILLAINENERYAEEIAKEIKMTRSGVRKELIKLEIEEYVILNKNTFNKNKKLYSMNWKRINFDFLNYLIDKVLNKKASKFKGFSKLIRNRHLTELMKSSFVLNYDEYLNKNQKLKLLDSIFQEIVNELVYYLNPSHRSDLKKLARDDKSLREFLSFVKFLKEKVLEEHTETSDVLDEFYHRTIDSEEFDLSRKKGYRKITK